MLTATCLCYHPPMTILLSICIGFCVFGGTYWSRNEPSYGQYIVARKRLQTTILHATVNRLSVGTMKLFIGLVVLLHTIILSLIVLPFSWISLIAVVHVVKYLSQMCPIAIMIHICILEIQQTYISMNFFWISNIKVSWYFTLQFIRFQYKWNPQIPGWRSGFLQHSKAPIQKFSARCGWESGHYEWWAIRSITIINLTRMIKIER